MANIKSSAKRDEKSKELRAKNRADKTELKTMMKSLTQPLPKATRTQPSVPIKLLLRQSITQPARV